MIVTYNKTKRDQSWFATWDSIPSRFMMYINATNNSLSKSQAPKTYLFPQAKSFGLNEKKRRVDMIDSLND